MTTIVSVSLPADVRSRLDDEAVRAQRSRSFVVAAAILQYLAHQERDAFRAARERTLREGVSLTPSARVHLAEELWGEFASRQTPRAPWTASFDTFDQYQAWRRRGGPAG